jgi:rRNA maturation protein Nop10
MRCPKCHHEVYSTDDKCMSCGYDLTKASPSAHRSVAKSRRRRSPATGTSLARAIPKLIACVVIMGIAGGIWWHHKSEAQARAMAAKQAMEQGKSLFIAARYGDAIASFQKAQELGDPDAERAIQQCRMKIAQIEAAQQQAAAESEASRARADQFFAQAEQQPNETQTKVTSSRQVRSTGMAPGYKDRDFYINIAKRAVIEELKAPRTAQFEGGGLRAIGVEIDRRDGHVLVHGEVDAQNGFGAMLRGLYMVTMQPDGRVTFAYVTGGG